jgi:hypothetical protein
MKNRFLVLVSSFCLLSMSSLKAQGNNFTIRSGGGFTGSLLNKEYVLFGDVNTSYALYEIQKSVISYGALIYPQYHLIKKPVTNTRSRSKRYEQPEKPYDFAIGAPTKIALNIGFFHGQNFSTILYNIAPSLDINFGSMTAKGQGKKAGAFAGVGFGVANTNQMNVTDQDVTGVIDPSTVNYKQLDPGTTTYKPRALGIGPMVHFGGEVINPFSRFRGSKVGLRLGYQPAINRGGVDYYAISFFSNFGGGGRW